jgi:AhpD family alkylhydroperoxidase
MEARLDFFTDPLAARMLKHIDSAGRAVAGSDLPGAAQELMKIRAGRIGGCGCCTGMHTEDAAAAGETSVRLNPAAAWREATVFTEAERAAL